MEWSKGRTEMERTLPPLPCRIGKRMCERQNDEKMCHMVDIVNALVTISGASARANVLQFPGRRNKLSASRTCTRLDRRRGCSTQKPKRNQLHGHLAPLARRIFGMSGNSGAHNIHLLARWI